MLSGTCSRVQADVATLTKTLKFYSYAHAVCVENFPFHRFPEATKVKVTWPEPRVTIAGLSACPKLATLCVAGSPFSGVSGIAAACPQLQRLEFELKCDGGALLKCGWGAGSREAVGACCTALRSLAITITSKLCDQVPAVLCVVWADARTAVRALYLLDRCSHGCTC